MSPTGNKTSLGIVFATVCIDLLGFGLVMPLLPIYAKELTSGYESKREQGLIIGALMISFSIMQFVFAPLWGRVSDRIGRRPVLLLSLTGSTLFYALLGIATSQRSLAWMILARIGAGVAGATIPTAQAYIADVTSRENRAKGMALIGAAFGLGFTLGPLIGAAALYMDWTGDSGGLSPMPGYVASILSAMALCVAIFKLPESYDSSAVPEQRKHVDWASLREALATPSIGLLLATSFLAIFALAGFEGTISLNMKDKFGRDGLLNDREILARVLLMFAYIGLLLCLIQGMLVRRLAGRISDGRLAMSGMGMAITGFILLALAVSVAGGGMLPLMLATAVVIAGLAFAGPAIQSLISRRSDPAKQGVVLGAGESISSVARMTGMFFGVTLYEQAQSLPYWSSAGMMALALSFVIFALPRGGDWIERVMA